MTKLDPASRIFCALDTPDVAAARKLSRALKGAVGGVKLGLEFFAANGPKGVAEISGMPVFLDLKLHDIPNTVAGAVRSVLPLNPVILTVHAAGGAAMLRAAADAAKEKAGKSDGVRPKLVAVTVLTSLDQEDLQETGIRDKVSDQVRRLASLARNCGIDGVVCSAHEITALRADCGPDFMLVVPGLRPSWAAAQDQKRVTAPIEALELGADILVIGRPITGASDPRQAALRIAGELAAF